MTASKTDKLVLLLLLTVTALGGTVQYQNGTNVTVADPTSGTINSSFSLWNPTLGSATFNRMRSVHSPSYVNFGEFY